MGTTNIQVLVAAYKKGGEGLEAIYEGIARLLYADPARFGFDGDDDAAEAICRYRKRIRTLATRYIDNGSSFEAYLTSSLRYIARTMRRENRRRKERDAVCERNEVWDYENRSVRAALHPALRGIAEDGEPLESQVRPLRPRVSSTELAAFKNRLVFLYLKCAWESSDEKTRQVANVAGVNEEWLAAATAQSLRSLESERRRHEKLSNRRDRSWGRLRLLEAKLHEEIDITAKSQIEASMIRERIRLERVRGDLRAFRPIVSNSVVARVLGVPKGTVDSGLYYLKKRESKKYDAGNL